jgi:hypothetical protein
MLPTLAVARAAAAAVGVAVVHGAAVGGESASPQQLRRCH